MLRCGWQFYRANLMRGLDQIGGREGGLSGVKVNMLRLKVLKGERSK